MNAEIKEDRRQIDMEVNDDQRKKERRIEEAYLNRDEFIKKGTKAIYVVMITSIVLLIVTLLLMYGNDRAAAVAGAYDAGMSAKGLTMLPTYVWTIINAVYLYTHISWYAWFGLSAASGGYYFYKVKKNEKEFPLRRRSDAEVIKKNEEKEFRDHANA